MTFFVMNLACFFLKIGSAPNFRPSFKFFTWQTAGLGALLSAAAMFFIDETYAAIAISVLVFLFFIISVRRSTGAMFHKISSIIRSESTCSG
jgi:solute carrier family 12 (potassium/chloride transporters), member 9